MIAIQQEMKETNPYVEQFERLEKEGPARQPSWLFPIRKAGMARFAEVGFPTTRQEDWRFTNVSPIRELPFKPFFASGRQSIPKDVLARFPFAGLDAIRLVFVNGRFVEELSAPALGGAVITNLGAALAQDAPLLQKHLGQHALSESNPFAALNTAFFHDGGCLFVPPDIVLDKPVHLLFVSTAKEPGVTTHPRNLIIVGARSQVTLLETYVRTEEAATFTNAVTEFVVEEGARLEHIKYQDESEQAYHLASLQARLHGRARFLSHSIVSGARLSRNNINTVLEGEGIECVLNGLYVTRGEQLADHHMVVEHAKPNCASHEYFNGILADRSKGVFHGRILVRREAQKTDAKQTNKNLLLSDEATIDTKPQLEIYADDVKCTHGATIGQLDEESIFYLRARGIGIETARRMLIHSFAGEIIGRIECEAVREELDREVWERLEQPSFAK